MRQRPEGYIASWMRLKRSHLDLEFWLQNATWALRNDAFFTFFSPSRDDFQLLGLAAFEPRVL